MRCLALAQGWQQRGGTANFACVNIPASLSETLHSQAFLVTRLDASPGSDDDAYALAKIAVGADWIVLDGEGFSPAYLLHLRSDYQRVMLIDDFGVRRNLAVDVILNQNLNAGSQLYPSTPSHIQRLLGTQYLLLRREFRARSRRTYFPAHARKILVSLGGTDPDDLSSQIANACSRLESGKFEVTIATTSANPNLAHLRERCKAIADPLTLLVDAPNMADVMANSDLAVIAAGGTLWELLYLGCPVLSYSRNELQAQSVSDLAALGAIGDMGAVEAFDEATLAARIEILAATPDDRRSMSDTGASIVDGHGVTRVMEQLLQARKVSPMPPVEIVPIALENQDEFTAMALDHFRGLNPDFTPHEDWKQHYFSRIQNNPNHHLEWILKDGKRAGFILYGIEDHRFLPRKTGAIYEVYVTPEFRRLGLAREAASQAIQTLRQQSSRIQLEVMEGNTAAAALWKSLGFRKVTERYVLAGDGR